MIEPQKLTVMIKRLPHSLRNPCPTYMTEGSAGMDLEAAPAQPITLQPMSRAKIPTGFAISLPDGYEAQVRPRSGLALKEGVTVLNSPGTIDSDYRGEISVILANFGNKPTIITRGMRIAQLIVAPFTRVVWKESPELSESKRGADGFGSTGTVRKNQHEVGK